MAEAAPQRNSSRTALGVAALRAVHQLLDGEPKILHDPIAVRLLDADVLKQIQSNPARAHEPLAEGLRSHVVLRSRFAEERMAQAVQRGVRQCVILGAGFDTFAFRQPEWARSLHIYEVDHRATQEEKRQRLQSAGIRIPANLEFVAIDFESVSLRAGLQTSSLNFSEPAFFSCLGVLVYLSREATDAIFQLVATFPASSEIVFTFSTPDAEDRTALANMANALGEPWQTHFDPQTLVRVLRAIGFSTISFLSPEAADRTYFQSRNDGLHAPRRGGIGAAVVAAHTGSHETGNLQQE
ncbi:MAG: class I SAM-dependent methyltransferase [Terriglobales bacterium]|jgi:methyltransferase (TIGR00027 family)